MRTANDRGAIMLIAVFFAIFGVAILYYMIGMGQAVLFRERMQDAADATALSAAIANARGMNFIVLINIVMAALLAILVTIKLVETIAILGMFIAAALAWVTFGATLAAIPPLRVVQEAMQDAYDTAKSPIFSALEILNETATAVKWITPPTADLIASSNISEHWGAPIEKGFAVGSREIKKGLPVEDDTFDRLCGKAGEFPIELAKAAINCPAIDPIFDKLESAMSAITSTLSEWFCGDSSGGAPTYDHTENAGYPKIDSDDQCSASRNDITAGKAINTTNPDCNKQQQEQLDAQPDPKTGSCQAGHDCTLGGPYDSRVTAAREQCDPSKSPRPVEIAYQYRAGHVDYLWKGGQWQRQVPKYDSFVLGGSTSSPPCGPTEAMPTLSVGYNKVVRRSQNVSDILPVCSNEKAPSAPLFVPPTPNLEHIDFIEVTQILGCTKPETKHIDVSRGSNGRIDKSVGGEDKNGKAPKHVEINAKLGDDNFQLRSLIIGHFPSKVADGIIKLSLWKQVQPDNPLGALESLGGISFAQAEYFYEGTEERDEWMWHMKWRARLRRFRLPDQDQLGSLKSLVGSILPDAVGNVLNAEQLIAH
jgi:hypothetical protein